MITRKAINTIISGEYAGDFDNQLLRRIKSLEASRVQTTKQQTTATAVNALGIMTGTHGDRILVSPATLPEGTLFYETDRQTLYIALPLLSTKLWLVIP